MVLLIRNNVMIYLNLRETRTIERNKTAIVLFVTVLVFFICHLSRFVMTIFDLIYPFNLEHETFCAKQGRYKSFYSNAYITIFKISNYLKPNLYKLQVSISSDLVFVEWH